MTYTLRFNGVISDLVRCDHFSSQVIPCGAESCVVCVLAHEDVSDAARGEVVCSSAVGDLGIVCCRVFAASGTSIGSHDLLDSLVCQSTANMASPESICTVLGES